MGEGMNKRKEILCKVSGVFGLLGLWALFWCNVAINSIEYGAVRSAIMFVGMWLYIASAFLIAFWVTWAFTKVLRWAEDEEE